MQSIDLNDPVAVLLSALRALERAGIQAATYGGLALAIYGEPRETKDADLAVVGVSGTQAKEALSAEGFNVLLAWERMTFGGQFVTRLTLFGGAAGSLNTVDLIEARSSRFAADVLARSLTGSIREQSLRVVTPEDFILLKILATRERDLEDVITVLGSLGGQIDRALVEREVSLLSSEISDHEVAARWQLVQSKLGLS